MIELESGHSFTVRSRPTFFSVASDRVTRIVYTPMPEAGDLQKAGKSLHELFAAFPEQQRNEANEWLQKVLAQGDADAGEFTRFSNKFELPEGGETYIEFRPVSLPGKWYSSVHLYDSSYAKRLSDFQK